MTKKIEVEMSWTSGASWERREVDESDFFTSPKYGKCLKFGKHVFMRKGYSVMRLWRLAPAVKTETICCGNCGAEIPADNPEAICVACGDDTDNRKPKPEPFRPVRWEPSRTGFGGIVGARWNGRAPK